MITELNITCPNKKLSDVKFDLAIVVPVYNEELNIKKVLLEWDHEIKKINKIKFCFIVVNDGSKDNTFLELMKLDLEMFIINKNNSGHGRSIRIGYDFCNKCIETDFVLQIDSDGQCMPKFFNDFWKNRLSFDFISGFRITRGDGIVRKITSKISSFLSSAIVGRKLYDANTPYRLFKTSVLKEALKHVNESFDIHNIALTFIIYTKNYKVLRVNIDFPNRDGGENSINFLKVFQMGANMLIDLYILNKNVK